LENQVDVRWVGETESQVMVGMQVERDESQVQTRIMNKGIDEKT